MMKKYARLFMEILFSLEKGEELFYAPGLPFFEDEVSEIERSK
jgi:hypothetical protein